MLQLQKSEHPGNFPTIFIFVEKCCATNRSFFLGNSSENFSLKLWSSTEMILLPSLVGHLMDLMNGELYVTDNLINFTFREATFKHPLLGSRLVTEDMNCVDSVLRKHPFTVHRRIFCYIGFRHICKLLLEMIYN